MEEGSGKSQRETYSTYIPLVMGDVDGTARERRTLARDKDSTDRGDTQGQTECADSDRGDRD